jgi:hypothetical protein
MRQTTRTAPSTNGIKDVSLMGAEWTGIASGVGAGAGWFCACVLARFKASLIKLIRYISPSNSRMARPTVRKSMAFDCATNPASRHLSASALIKRGIPLL